MSTAARVRAHRARRAAEAAARRERINAQLMAEHLASRPDQDADRAWIFAQADRFWADLIRDLE